MTYTFRPLEGAFRVIAWGRGVPSTTMAVMSALGDLEVVDAVLHCDAGWEHYGTYDVGDYFSGWLTRRGVHVEVLATGDIRREGCDEHVHMPLWTETGGPLQWQCTRHFKVAPQRRRMRELLGYDPSRAPAPPAGSIEQWIGYTFEERHRMRPSRRQYVVSRWPLIERRMTRRDCIDYLRAHGLRIPPPSSCVGCPFKSAERWRLTCAGDMDEAIAFDEGIRGNPLMGKGGLMADRLYVYKPQGGLPVALAEADFDLGRDGDGGQLSFM